MSWQFECIDNALNEPELDEYCECGRCVGRRYSHMCEYCEAQARYDLGMDEPIDQEP
jgi:hypothetical protein